MRPASPTRGPELRSGPGSERSGPFLADGWAAPRRKMGCSRGRSRFRKPLKRNNLLTND